MFKRLLKILLGLALAIVLAMAGLVLYIRVYQAKIEADLSARLTAQLGKTVTVKNVGSYFSLSALGLTLESAAVDQSYVKNIRIEVSPLESLAKTRLVVSHVSVEEAKLTLTKEMLAEPPPISGPPAPAADRSSQHESTPDFVAFIQPIANISELFKEISISDVTVELPFFAAPIKLESFTLARSSLGRVLKADIRHLDATVHAEVALTISPEKVEVVKLEISSRQLVLTPDMQLWLPPEQRLKPLSFDELLVQAAGTAIGHAVHLQLLKLDLKTNFVAAQVTGLVDFDAATKQLSYKAEGQVNGLTLAALDFVPVDLLGAKTMGFITGNIHDLTASDGTVLLSGGASGPPELKLSIAVEIPDLGFDPAWPHIQGAKANVDLTTRSVAVVLHTAKFRNLTLSDVTARIDDLTKPVLAGKLKFADTLPRILAALGETPLQPKLAAASQKAKIVAGNVDADLSVTVDLTAAEILPEFVGPVHLDQVAIDVTAPPAKVRNMTGTLRLLPNLIASEGFKLDVNGEPVALRFTHDERGRPARTELLLDARLSAKNLGELAKKDLGPALTGVATYSLKATLLHAKGGPQVDATLSSDLAGTAIDIPGIFQKTKESKAKLRVDAKSEGETLVVAAGLGNIAARAKIQLSGEHKIGARVSEHVAGEPEFGKLSINLPTILGDVEFTDDFMSIHARFKKLHVVTGDEAAATPLTKDPAPLKLPAAPAQPAPKTVAPATPSPAPIDPRTLPVVDFACDDLQIDKRKLGSVELLTMRTADGFEVHKLNIEVGYFSQYNTSGYWVFNQGSPELHLQSFVYFRDAGEALKRLDLYQNLDGIKGSVPIKLDLLKPIDGTKNLDLVVAFDLRSGTVRNLDNVFLDILKIITFKKVLSFKDEGLLIRQARGKIRLTDGKMEFINTGIELDSVALKLNGPIDFNANTLALKVATKLRISRTLSTAAIASVNPVAAASMIATDTSFEFDFIDNIGEHTYELNGTLDDPKLADVDFNLLEKTGIEKGLKKLKLMDEDKNEQTDEK